MKRVFGKDGVHYSEYQKHNPSSLARSFDRGRAIFFAAKEDYEGGYLFNIRSLINAEILDDVLEQAKELLRAKYKDPACVLAGVTLERALKDLCDQEGIPHGKVDKMNADLCKAGIYNVGMQKQITAWADRRNSAAHGDCPSPCYVGCITRPAAPEIGTLLSTRWAIGRNRSK